MTTSPDFSVMLRPDHIVVVRLANWKRQTVDAWMEHVKAHDGKLRSPLRLLYDLQDAGPPSRYILETIGPFMETLTIPEDTRNAYIFKAGPYERYVMSFIRRMPPKTGVIKAFTSIDEAVKWLLETDV